MCLGLMDFASKLQRKAITKYKATASYVPNSPAASFALRGRSGIRGSRDDASHTHTHTHTVVCINL